MLKSLRGAYIYIYIHIYAVACNCNACMPSWAQAMFVISYQRGAQGRWWYKTTTGLWLRAPLECEIPPPVWAIPVPWSLLPPGWAFDALRGERWPFERIGEPFWI